MAGIVFAVRGDSLDARYSNGGKTGVSLGVGFSVTADVNAIGGFAIIAGANNSPKNLIWPGRFNTPNGRAISMLCRINPGYTGAPTQTRPLLPFVTAGDGRFGRIEVSHAATTGNVNGTLTNELGTVVLNGSSFNTWSPLNQYYDLVFTWDGTSNVNSAKFYVNASILGQLTPTGALSSSWANTWFDSINLSGGVVALNMNNSYINEIIFWDYVIDPTSVTLTSGIASLNGSTRNAFVDVAALDGLSYSNPGATNVKTGVGYTYAGASYTGSYIASERYSDPGVGNVLSGTSYLFNAATLTGTYNNPGSTDPGVGNVRINTQYVINGTTLTGTLPVPTAASGVAGTLDLNNIKENIQYIFEQANTTTSSPYLSQNLSNSKKVKNILKVNPEMLIPQANMFPLVTCWISEKPVKRMDISKNQLSAKRRATVNVNIAATLWNNNFVRIDEDPADEDINYLMENIELILRAHHDLGGSVEWQTVSEVKYYATALDEQTHLRSGVLKLECEVFY